MRDSYDGKRVVLEFTMLHEGWECDNYGCMTEDGQLWNGNDRNSERLRKMDEKEARECMVEMQSAVDSIERALRVKLALEIQCEKGRAEIRNCQP